MIWGRQSGGLAAAAVPVAIRRLDVLGIEPDGRAGCLVSVEDRPANQRQVDGFMRFEQRMPGMKIEDIPRPVNPDELNELGGLHLLSRVPKQTVVPRHHDFRCPFARRDAQDSELQWQPCRLSPGQLDVGVDPRDKGRHDRVSLRMIVAQLAFHVAPEPQQTRSDIG